MAVLISDGRIKWVSLLFFVFFIDSIIVVGEEILSAIRKDSAKSFKFDEVYDLNIDEVRLHRSRSSGIFSKFHFLY